MNKRDLQFILTHIDAVTVNLGTRLDTIDRRLDRIETRLDTVIDTLAAHIGDTSQHGQADA